MNHTHLLLTRFNVRESEQESLALDKEWLHSRFELFNKYCFPSVQQQTNTNFKWVILFDGNTPDQFKALEAEYQKQVKFELHFEYIDGWYDYDHLEPVLSKYIDADSQYLITSRVDNDDAIAATYMEEAAKAALFGGGRSFISFENGVQYFSEKGLMYEVEHKHNHFTTLVEPLDQPFFSVLKFNHTGASKEGDFQTFNTTEPMWAEVVHGGNQLNNYTPVYKYKATESVNSKDLFGFEVEVASAVKAGKALRKMKLSYTFARLKKYRLVLSNYLYGTSATAANALISLLIYPYVIRALGIEQYGLYAFALIIANTIIQIESTPFNLPFGRDVAAANGDRKEKSNIFSTVMSAKLLLIMVSSLVFLPVVMLLPQTEPYRAALIITYLSILGNPFMPNWYYQAIQKTKVIAYIQISVRLLSIPFILLFITEPQHVVRFAIIYTACTLLCALISFIYLKRKEGLEIVFTPIKKSWQAIRRCVPTFMDSISETLTKQLAGIMIGSVFGMAEMAYYDLAGKLTQIISYGVAGINNALMPHVISRGNADATQKMIKMEALLGVAIMVLVALLGKPAIWLLGGAGMEPAYILTLILTGALVADFISDGVVYLSLIPAGRIKEIPYGRYVALAVFLISCPLVSFITFTQLTLVILLASVIRLIFCLTQIRKNTFCRI